MAVDTPIVESVRASRRVGPDGNVVFDLVAEVTQRVERRLPGGKRVELYGGATILIDAWGDVRFVIRKRVLREKQDAEAIAFLTGDGAAYWHADGKTLHPVRSAFKLIHERRRAEEAKRVKQAVAEAKGVVKKGAKKGGKSKRKRL